jgi:hydroxypyruvate isomerase
MERRTFITRSGAGLSAFVLTGNSKTGKSRSPAGAPFRLKYAPSIGQFKMHAGDDPLNQIRFMADEGFRAVFDNGIMSRPASLQEAIAAETARLKMTLGPFVLYADFAQKSFVTRDPEARHMLTVRMKQGVETAKRIGCRWALVVPGRLDESLAVEYQTANVIDNLKFCLDICVPAGLILVLEPLNPRDHPGLFLTRIPHAAQICRAVDSPSCRILDDIYHQQISEGNLIPNIDMAWNEIASFHVGDNPERKEPGTGEINFRSIFRHLHGKGYDGVICLEHGQSLPGKAGERAVIDAYREADAF